MHKSILFLAAAPALLGAPSALAQEAEAPARHFAGLRAEATLGYDQTSEDTVGKTLRGMRVGGAVGYDLAIGTHITIGVEAGVGWTVAGNETIGPFVVPGGSSTPVAYRVSAAHDLDVSARLGYAVSPKTLVYAKAGWADAAYRYSFSAPSQYTGYGNIDNGVRLGLGFEQKLGKHVYAKAEYRYTLYGEDYGNDEASRHQLVTGLGVRF